MYSVVLTTHSIVRWLVIAAGLVATVHAWRASSWRGAAKGSAAGLIFTALFDIQLLLGLALYVFLSPITADAMRHAGTALAHEVTRFWLVEHPFGMIVALALAHIGRAHSRQGVEDRTRRRRAAIYFTVATVIVLISSPWPFMGYGRPLLW